MAWSADWPLASGQLVKAVHMNDLVNAINERSVVANQLLSTSYSNLPTVSAGKNAMPTEFNQVRTRLLSLAANAFGTPGAGVSVSVSPPAAKSSGDLMTAADMNSLRTEIQKLAWARWDVDYDLTVLQKYGYDENTNFNTAHTNAYNEAAADSWSAVARTSHLGPGNTTSVSATYWIIQVWLSRWFGVAPVIGTVAPALLDAYIAYRSWYYGLNEGMTLAAYAGTTDPAPIDAGDASCGTLIASKAISAPNASVEWKQLSNLAPLNLAAPGTYFRFSTDEQKAQNLPQQIGYWHLSFNGETSLFLKLDWSEP